MNRGRHVLPRCNSTYGDELMKETAKSRGKCERKTGITKIRGTVPENTKEVMADLVAKLSQKLAAGPATGSADKEPRTTAQYPDLDGLTVGVDLGDKRSTYCILGLTGETLTEGALATTREGFMELFQAMTASRVVMEVGTHSAWVREARGELRARGPGRQPSANGWDEAS